VAVCTAEPWVGQTLREALHGLAGVRAVRVVERGEQLEAAWPVLRPDLALIDAGLRDLDGVDTAQRLLAGHPDATVVVLTTRPSDPRETAAVVRAVQAGARGYVSLDASPQELGCVLRGVIAGRRPPRGARGAQPLTARELQVLVAMSRGRSNAEIGRELYLSEDTVKTHARRVFRKLGAVDRAHAVALGFRAGLLR
jgi:DNA-binding NarL/FixJ family response regulator